MPKFDGTGPGGQGPGTGRGRGSCGGGYGPGNYGRGGFGQGRGQGRGMGRGRCFRDRDYGPPGGDQASYWDAPPPGSYPNPQDELVELKAQAQMLTQNLEAIRHRMAELEKSRG